MEHTRDIWSVHVDVEALGGRETAKDNMLHLLADHTAVRVDAVEVIVGEESVIAQLKCEHEARDIVDSLCHIIIPGRWWMSRYEHTIYASLTREELDWAPGVGPVWVQRHPGKSFRIITPNSCLV